MTAVSSREGYQAWSATYDSDPNPLLALESRLLTPRLGNLNGLRVLDVAAGTGRWMEYAASHGARATGIDISPQMLFIAAGKPSLSRRLVLGDIQSLPFLSRAIDLAICSFALSYLPFATAAFGEMTRVARRVIVSDMHPEAMLRGWTRSFQSGGRSWKIEHFYHSISDLNQVAQAAGMKPDWTAEAAFDLPELEFFERAGRRSLFHEVRHTSAVFAASWSRPRCE